MASLALRLVPPMFERILRGRANVIARQAAERVSPALLITRREGDPFAMHADYHRRSCKSMPAGYVRLLERIAGFYRARIKTASAIGEQ